MDKSIDAGIDISKKSMDAAICREGIVNREHHLCVENTAEGYRKMMTWIIGRTSVNREDMPVRMEYTGMYSPFDVFLKKTGLLIQWFLRFT